MKFLKVSALVATVAISLAFTLATFKPNNKPVIYPITMCGATFGEVDFNAPVSLIAGLGDLHYQITTRDSSAQKFFDQGLRLVYGFNHVEALRAFKEASRLDP